MRFTASHTDRNPFNHPELTPYTNMVSTGYNERASRPPRPSRPLSHLRAMFGPKLRRPDQPLWMRTVLGLFEFASSVKLAVILIFSCALALAWATFVESAYGTPAVQFGVYQTWWFALLCFLLALNIFCAAAIRYPWKRHQTGFVITHIGLLTLLFGCLIQRQRGIDAQMSIFEGQVGHRAFEDSHHFHLDIQRTGSLGKSESIDIPFAAGPFNWEDYTGRLSKPIKSTEHEGAIFRAIANSFAKLNGFVFRLANRDRGVIYDQDGVKLEVLDYYSDTMEYDAPLVKLRISSPRGMKMDENARPVEGTEEWQPVELFVRKSQEYPFGIPQRQPVGGGTLTFGMTGLREQADAFLQSAPEGELGDKGQVVLYADGEVTRVDVDKKLGGGKFDLGKSGLQAEIVEQFDSPKLSDESHELVEDTSGQSAKNPIVRIQIYRDDKPLSKIYLFADEYQLNMQDFKNKIFGSYWYDHKADTAEKRMAGGSRSRIDILQEPFKQGETPKLVYRYWNGKQLVFARSLPTDGTPVDAFKMPIAQLKLAVDQVMPAEKPEIKIRSLPFSAKKEANAKAPAAKVRLTVDGKSDEFWIAAISTMPALGPLRSLEKRRIESDRLEVALTLPPDQVDIGFGVRLEDFQRKLDPGTSQPSHFSSIVDFVSLDKNNKELQGDVLITMNAPVDFSDPSSGKSYRLFQESYIGPIRPGVQQFEQYYNRYFAPKGIDEGYISTLTVNLDPGRAVKYSGCLLVVAGILTMFYMRAYFFKPTPKPKLSESAEKPKRNREPVPVT
jgi:hypothetical protein